MEPEEKIKEAVKSLKIRAEHSIDYSIINNDEPWLVSVHFQPFETQHIKVKQRFTVFEVDTRQDTRSVEWQLRNDIKEVLLKGYVGSSYDL